MPTSPRDLLMKFLPEGAGERRACSSQTGRTWEHTGEREEHTRGESELWEIKRPLTPNPHFPLSSVSLIRFIRNFPWGGTPFLPEPHSSYITRECNSKIVDLWKFLVLVQLERGSTGNTSLPGRGQDNKIVETIRQQQDNCFNEMYEVYRSLLGGFSSQKAKLHEDEAFSLRPIHCHLIPDCEKAEASTYHSQFGVWLKKTTGEELDTETRKMESRKERSPG